MRNLKTINTKILSRSSLTAFPHRTPFSWRVSSLSFHSFIRLGLYDRMGLRRVSLASFQRDSGRGVPGTYNPHRGRAGPRSSKINMQIFICRFSYCIVHLEYSITEQWSGHSAPLYLHKLPFLSSCTFQRYHCKSDIYPFDSSFPR